MENTGMNSNSRIWIVVLVLAGGYLAWRVNSYHAGAVYVVPKTVTDAETGLIDIVSLD